MNVIKLFIKDLYYFTDLKNKMYIFLLFFQPLSFLTIIYFISLSRDNIDLSKFIIASSIISMWSYILYSSGSSIMIQKWNDTLNLLISSPTSLYKIILIKVLNNSVISAFSFLLTLIYSKFIFHFTLKIENLLYFSLSFVLLLFSLTALGVTLASIFTMFRNIFDIQNLIVLPITLLSGAFYSIDNYPLIFQIVSYLLPITWSIKNMYISIDSNIINVYSIILNILIILLYLIVSFLLIKILENKLKVNGTAGEL